MKLFLAIAFLAGVSARCQENCNGNGLCGANDKCQCFKGFQGTSCNDRVCAFGAAWIGDHSSYVECSGKGVCDRKSGLCKCQDGFEGSSCSRMSCPEDCNNHGQCLTQKYFGGASDDWDQEMIQGCQCDPGYSGNACENRLCPRGDDKMTEATGATAAVFTLLVTHGTADTTNTGQFKLKFTDKHTTETYSTRALTFMTISEIAIREALISLPNKVIPDCTVAQTASTSTAKTFTVTMDHAHTAGPQNFLERDASACTHHGCEIISAGAQSGQSVVVTSGSVDAGAENAVCSNRGECDTSSGECICNDGYKGQACAEQTTYT